jgi:isoleucyl-tRNA synthetase
MIKKILHDFDFIAKRDDYYFHNKTIERYMPEIHYRDNDRNMEVDLHKPYVDTYRFQKDGHTYKRVSEVMDCRFESGSMPFGQANYT